MYEFPKKLTKADILEGLAKATTPLIFSRLLQGLLWKENHIIEKERFIMLFEKNFKVVEILESGVTITHLLRGKRRDVKKDIEMIKLKAKRYEMVGKNGMIVWA